MRIARVVGFALVVLVASCQSPIPDKAKSILDKASEFELYSLEPVEEGDKDKAIYGWKVLGKTTVKDIESRTVLLSGLEKSVAAGGRGPACFDPRHAIRAVHEGKTTDLLICFECSRVFVYLDGKKVVSRVLGPGADQEMFDKILRDAGVPLAKKR
jgi:hypothetical protein